MPYLIQKTADGNVIRKWDLKNKPLSAGRGEEVDLRIEDKEMSRKHFVLSPTPSGWVVKDLGSRNGTLVNGEPVTEVMLDTNDKICAGKSHFVFTESLGTVMQKLEQEDRRYSTFVRKLSDPKP